VGVFAVVPAGAAIRHGFDAEATEALGRGVPAGPGVLVSGGLSGVNALTVDSGHLWIAEKIEGSSTTRVDEFDGGSGGFAGVQLNETGSLGQLNQSVAVGHVTGEEEVYVDGVNESAGVVGVFGSSGALQSVWSGAGVPGGRFSGVSGVAVDGFGNVLEDWAAGDVYVAETFGGAVDVFKPVAGGGEPAKPVARLTGTCAAPGSCPGEEIPFSRPSGVAVSALDGEVLVVDGNERVDVFRPGVVVGEYEFVRTLSGPPPTGTFGRVGAVTVDGGNGEIYVKDGLRTVDQFSSEGVFQGRLTSTPAGPFHSVQGLAVDALSHDLYVGDSDSERLVGAVDVFGAGVVVPDVETGVATAGGAGVATLSGTVDPVEAGPVSCEFVYGSSAGSLDKTAECQGPGSKATPIGNGSGSVPVTVTIEGLEPDTTYFYRLQASDKNGLNTGEEWQDHQFTAEGPGLHGESVSQVAADSANLEATIDPHGAPTSYYFQYGTSTGYGSESPVAPGVGIGSGEGDVIVPVRHVQDLLPGTVYHYRVVAVSELAPGVVESFPGIDQTFTTQPAGAAFALADGRHWELVSPADKHGAKLFAHDGGVVQAGVSGQALTYVASAPTENGAAGFSTFVQVLSSRTAAGVWQSRDIASATAAASGLSGAEYAFFSANLQAGVLQPPGGAFTPSLSSEASEQTPYLRVTLDGTGAFCSEGCYRPLVTGCPPPGQACSPNIQPYSNVPPGTMFGETDGCPSAKEYCGPAVLGASPDLKHIIVSPNGQGAAVAFTPDATPKLHALYEWSEGRLTLISRLPDGGQATQPELGGNHVLRNAVSSDGSRVIWSDRQAALYLRDTVKGETLRLDGVQGGTGKGNVEAVFQSASVDGSRVFFIDGQELTVGAGKEGNLYECRIVEEAGKLHCLLSDLTPATASGEPAKVRGQIIGASEDGSWVYFVAAGALTPDAAPTPCNDKPQFQSPSTLCNLYVAHDGVTRLVAVLAAADFPDWEVGLTALANLTARVSPDGRWLAFVSDRSLTGYDNRDRITGEPDEEVYLYDASSGHVVCVSCNPTGGRPTGVAFKDTLEGLDGGSKIWDPSSRLAASLPAWTSFGNSLALYQPRYLADDGRVFFNGSDALVPQDGNGLGDVYQYEPAGVGDCTPVTSTGADVYVPGEGGCVGLISSGSSKEESGFLDASATGGRDGEGHEGGGDVFFLTSARLTKEDFDTNFDVYTAHECTSAAPCSSPAAIGSPACENEEACKGASTPQPSIFGAPATSTFTGQGNLVPLSSSKAKHLARAQKHLTRAQLLARALGACHREKRHDRSRCERRAHKRYDRKPSHKATKG
jgi:WD40-like Beta Propeller Repeat